MTCDCDTPHPANTFALLDEQGLHPVCAYALVPLLADLDGTEARVVFTIEPAPAVTR